MKKRLIASLAILISAITLVSCSRATPEPVTITIKMSEYAFSPARLEAKVGQQVTVELVNTGQLAHEIMFGRDVMMMDGHPNGYQHDMFLDAGVEPVITGITGSEDHNASDEHSEEGHSGFMVLLHKSGDKGSMTFAVTEEMIGEWEIGCFELEGVHYTAGMVGTFVVTR